MATTPEQSQKISDLRQRMLENIKEGKPSHHGITEDELRESLGFIRQNRTAPAAAVAKKKRAAKAPVETLINNPKFAKFAALAKEE